MQTDNDILFQGYRNKVYTFESEPELKLGFEQESTFCSCKHYMSDFTDLSPCRRHSFGSLNTPPLFGDMADLRASFGELSSYSGQEQLSFDSPSFIDPDVVIRKSEGFASFDDALLHGNGVSDMSDEPNLFMLELDEPVTDTEICLPAIKVENVDEVEQTLPEPTIEPWSSEQTLLLSREGTRRARRRCNESTYLNRTKKTFE